jgi:hypothetical protein
LEILTELVAARIYALFLIPSPLGGETSVWLFLHKKLQQSLFSGSGNRTPSALSAIIGVDMNEFIKKLGCTERITDCPFAILSPHSAFRTPHSFVPSVLFGPLNRAKSPIGAFRNARPTESNASQRVFIKKTITIKIIKDQKRT